MSLRSQVFRVSLAWLVAVLVLATAAEAYTLVLKDGSKVIARDEPRIENGRALFTMQNGAAGSLDATQIDIDKTVAANKGKEYGTGLVLDPTVTALPQANKPAEQRLTLSQYIAKNEGSLRELPAAKRATRQQGVPPTKTKAGFDDLFEWDRQDLSDMDLAGEIKRFYRAQGIEEIGTYSGSQRKRVLIEVATNSEAALFLALEVGAKAMLELERTRGNAVDALELVMRGPNRSRGGQFVMTRELAADIVAKPKETAVFFVRNVQF